MLGWTTATLRTILSITIALIVLAPCQPAMARTGTENTTTQHGISASIIPDSARPGDIVELRIEMNRETWGRFKLKTPKHPQMRTIAEEKIPVSYRGQLYKQRYSLFLQPVSSGDIAIGATSVTISTAAGEETVELPALALSVLPFDSPALSDVPLPLPPDEAAAQSGSMISLLFWICIAFAVLGIWSFIFFAMRDRKRRSVQSGSSLDLSQSSDTVQRIRRGVILKDDLENLLHDSNLSISAALRSKIEQAVYSAQVESDDLAILLREELIA